MLSTLLSPFSVSQRSKRGMGLQPISLFCDWSRTSSTHIVIRLQTNIFFLNTTVSAEMHSSDAWVIFPNCRERYLSQSFLQEAVWYESVETKISSRFLQGNHATAFNHLTSNVTTPIAHQKGYQIGNILGLAQSLQGNFVLLNVL